MEEQKEKMNAQPTSDKAFNRLIFSSVLSIVLCLFLLCSTTYAWFTDSVTQSSNTITAAGNCHLEIAVNDGVSDLDKIDEGITLVKDTVYTVTIKLPQGSSSGYCVISVGAMKYYSDYIRAEEAPKTLTFNVVAQDTFNNVTFTTKWGLHSRTGESADVKDGVLTIIGSPAPDAPVNNQ